MGFKVYVSYGHRFKHFLPTNSNSVNLIILFKFFKPNPFVKFSFVLTDERTAREYMNYVKKYLTLDVILIIFLVILSTRNNFSLITSLLSYINVNKFLTLSLFSD